MSKIELGWVETGRREVSYFDNQAVKFDGIGEVLGNESTELPP